MNITNDKHKYKPEIVGLTACISCIKWSVQFISCNGPDQHPTLGGKMSQLCGYLKRENSTKRSMYQNRGKSAMFGIYMVHLEG